MSLNRGSEGQRDQAHPRVAGLVNLVEGKAGPWRQDKVSAAGRGGQEGSRNHRRRQMLGPSGAQSPPRGGGGGTGSQPRPRGPPASPLRSGHLDSGGWWEGAGAGPGAGTGGTCVPPTCSPTLGPRGQVRIPGLSSGSWFQEGPPQWGGSEGWRAQSPGKGGHFLP